MGNIEGQSILEQAHFPLLLVHLSGALDAQNIEAMTRELDILIDLALPLEMPLFLVIDARSVSRVGSDFRKAFVSWESGVSEERFQQIGTRIMVHENPIVRGALTAVSWFSPRAKGIVAVKDVHSALAELREKMEPHGGLTTEQEQGVVEWLTPAEVAEA